MIKGYTAAQIRAAEAPLLAAGVPLMRRAAAALAAEVRRELGDAGRRAGRILILAGSGDNGGDALYAGAELAREGVEVCILTTGDRVHEAGLAAALAAGAQRTDAAGAVDFARSADALLDGILGTGTGANPALRGRAREAVAALIPVVTPGAAPGVIPVVTPGAAPKPGAGEAGSAGGRDRPRVIAVDIPSGISPDDGTVPDPLVLPADVTVTFGGCKAGLLLPPASALAGEVRLIDIGLGDELAKVEPVVVVEQRPGT